MQKSQLLSQRLNNQKLSAPAFDTPVEVVRWFGAVQAQDFPAAKWALGLRMRSATDALIEAAFNEGKILRTHVMRPTWHFVAPEDIRWLLKLTAPRVSVKCGYAFRRFELDESVFKQTNKILKNALKGGKHLTRATLQKVLNNAGVPADDPIRLGYILIRAELDALVCSGPRIGKQFTYALFVERVPQAKELGREEALAKLTRQYFASHGPASLPDFVWWSGLTMIDAQRGIAMVDSELEKTSIKGKDYWTSRTAHATTSLHSAHLLPSFDEYTVAYKDRMVLLDRPNMTAMGLLGPMIVIEGQIVGTWAKKNANKSVTIELRLFKTLTRSQKMAIELASNRYKIFLDAAM